MLRIEKDSHGCASRVRLSGWVQSKFIASIRAAMNDACADKILDLAEVTLVDIAVVRFLINREDEGVELAHCPAYVREWIVRERAEAAAAPALAEGMRRVIRPAV
jgi:hypothetical protein